MFAPTTYVRAGLGLAVAVALIGSHAWVYQAGGEHVQMQWQQERADTATAQAAAQAQAREREQAIARQMQIQRDQHAQQIARRTTSERSLGTELERVRAQAAAIATSASSGGAPTCRAAHEATAALADVFGQCASAHGALAKEAGELADQVMGLQDHIRATQGAGD